MAYGCAGNLTALAVLCCIYYQLVLTSQVIFKLLPDWPVKLTFSSSHVDRAIHCVDLRQPKEPLHLLKGHRKVVSYVQYISPNEIVSA